MKCNCACLPLGATPPALRPGRAGAQRCMGMQPSSRTQLAPAGARSRAMHARAEGEPSTSGPAQEPEDEGLLPEEDWAVPGGYQDTLSKNTKLGKAVDDACKELETLGQLEKESLSKANDLLRQLGYKGDLSAPAAKQQQPDQRSPE